MSNTKIYGSSCQVMKYILVPTISVFVLYLLLCFLCQDETKEVLVECLQVLPAREQVQHQGTQPVRPPLEERGVRLHGNGAVAGREVNRPFDAQPRFNFHPRGPQHRGHLHGQCHLVLAQVRVVLAFYIMSQDIFHNKSFGLYKQ